jgi:hypothetical protein
MKTDKYRKSENKIMDDSEAVSIRMLERIVREGPLDIELFLGVASQSLQIAKDKSMKEYREAFAKLYNKPERIPEF